MNKPRWLLLLVLLLLVTAAAGCAPGSARFTSAEPAGFWAGLWHGLICPIAFIVSLFSDGTGIYEINNTGGWYNFGYLLGVACLFGGSWGSGHGRRRKSRREREWEEIGRRVEDKVRSGIKRWLDEGESGSDWDRIGKRIEEEIKKELRRWADEG